MTRKSRTMIGAAAAIVAATLALAGCSGGGASTSSSGGVKYDASQKVTLHIAWWGADSRTQIMNKVFAQFEKKYPNISVVGQPVGDPNSLFASLATDFAAGTAPDVFALGGSEPQQMGSQGVLLDLSKVSKYLPLSNYPSSALFQGQTNGKQYTVPTGGNAVGVLINKTIFQQAGVPLPKANWTWNDLVNAADQISAAEKSQKIVGLDLQVQNVLGTYVAQENGVGLYSKTGKLAATAPEIQKWYELEQKLEKGGGISDPSVLVQDWNLTPDRSLFGTGKAAITFTFSNQIATYEQGIPNDQLEMVTPPSNTKSTGVSALPSQFWAIAAQTKYPAQSALLVNYLLNNTSAAKIILADRGEQFNPAVLKVVQPLLDPADAMGAAYLSKVLKAGVNAPPQPAGGENQQTLSENTESNILFGKTSASAGAQSWVSQMKSDLASGQ